MSIDRARFRRPVVPGDTVHYHMSKRRNRGRVWRFDGKATVNGQLVAEAEISAMIVDPTKQADQTGDSE
jgi:3-hydroxyacyl-[acyl-carrier-protein] dehydratase